MPLPKRPTFPAKAKSSDDGPRKKDSRFSNFQTEAKFRLPSKRNTKTKLDSRFSRLLNDPDFYNKATVDKYGREIERDAGKKKLEKFYRQAEDSDDDDDDNEDEVDEIEDEKAKKRDRNVKRQLAKVDIRGQNYDPIRDGGLSSSSDDSSSDEESDVEEDVEEETELAGQNNDVPMGEVTSRLAAVNLDWDNIRAADIMAVADSFVPADGRIQSVVIYPSEFGRERMQREELEGPPKEIFAASKKSKDDGAEVDDESDSDASQDEEQIKQQLLEESTGEEFDSKALRAYQLDRLRYYYAVITCSSTNVAKSIYDNLDGREYLSSANFFDLRFVPEDTTFDEDAHEECKELPNGYKPNEFTTGALSHSKVTLTWDADDRMRKEAQKRAFTKDELDENELQAYLGSDAESDDDAPQPDRAAALRAALGLESTSEPSRSSKQDSKSRGGEMEVTFSAALSTKGQKGSVFENEPITEESTLDAYKRKEKERKARRKERAKAIRAGLDPDAEVEEEPAQGNAGADEDDPWNDPFFASDSEDAKAADIKAKKAQKAKKRSEREKDEQEAAAQKANLELLMVDDEGNKVQHFDMNEIKKAEKSKKKGKKGKKAKDTAAVVEDDFKINTQDPRFAKLYESHEYAIDPTNPRYKGSEGMKALLEEGRKKRKHDRDDVAEVDTRATKRKKKKRTEVSTGDGEVDDLKKLAARVKAKSKMV